MVSLSSDIKLVTAFACDFTSALRGEPLHDTEWLCPDLYELGDGALATGRRAFVEHLRRIGATEVRTVLGPGDPAILAVSGSTPIATWTPGQGPRAPGGEFGNGYDAVLWRIG